MSAPPGPEERLFEAPDLAALQRNWPRIALRGAVLVLVPTLVVWLARTLGLYPTISMLPLPLGFLRAGPFAYEGKVIFAVVAILLGLAFLVPKRTPQLVIAVCVGGVLWTGHVFIQLQWARLFATGYRFRSESIPGPGPWTFAVLLLLVGVVYLLLENLLDTREQQRGRRLGEPETDALLQVGTRSLALMAGAGLLAALVLVLAYLGLRALLTDARLPFRVNPVFALFAMGIGLAILVALASRKRSPVEGAPLLHAARLAPARAAGPGPQPLHPGEPGFDAELRRRGL